MGRLSSHLNKLTVIALLIFGLIYTYHGMSHRLDGDFGWQLRFGKESVENSFPYLDTYTWTYYGHPWINHEWGTSILWWLIYSKIGYFAIVMLVSAAIWAAFALVPRIFAPRLTIVSLLVSLLAIKAASFYIAPRPTILTIIFFAILWWTLERIPQKKYYYCWPLLMWIWSALHGSWILGFIIIDIYLFGNLAQHIFSRYYTFFKPSMWKRGDYGRVTLFGALAFFATALNPYGLRLWGEIGAYFSYSYYKNFISEWLPSYVYPIYPLSLVLATIAAVLVARAFIYKRVTLVQLALFAALFVSGMQYKRNMTYLILLTVPVFTLYAHAMIHEIKKVVNGKNKMTLLLRQLTPVILTCFIFSLTLGAGRRLLTSRFDKTLWDKQVYLAAYGFPVTAAEFIQALPRQSPLFIFNDFHLGGYLNWVLPSDKIYIDGRGTVSWSLNSSTTLYQEFRAIRFEKNGLTKLEKTQANIVLIRKKYLGLPTPDVWNSFIFSSAYLDKILEPSQSELEQDLRSSTKWGLVYEDSLAEVWRRQDLTP